MCSDVTFTIFKSLVKLLLPLYLILWIYIGHKNNT